MMPGLDGHAVLRELRARYGYSVPVIMLTAAAGDEQAWQAWSGGIDYFLAKPFELGTLVDKIIAFTADADSDVARSHSEQPQQSSVGEAA
jgi:DNA-binding response OmpR family regulator